MGIQPSTAALPRFPTSMRAQFLPHAAAAGGRALRDHRRAGTESPLDLPQRALDRIGFKRIPVLENAFTFQQILETHISPLLPEKTFDLVVIRRQLLCDKAQGETTSEIELVLVRYGKVAI